MTDDLAAHWPDRLAGQDAERLRLVRAYADPSRGYHDLLHLREVLERAEEILADAATPYADRDAVLLAAWFHDAVYDSHGDLEERSAALAEEWLAGTPAGPELVAEVARLVRLTATHRPAEDDVAGQVLCDADLAILAADPPRYRAYVEGVRREYAALSDGLFRRGRAAALRDLASKPTLFHTAHASRQWEEPARANLREELARLDHYN